MVSIKNKRALSRRQKDNIADMITYSELRSMGLYETMKIALPEAHATMKRVAAMSKSYTGILPARNTSNGRYGR